MATSGRTLFTKEAHFHLNCPICGRWWTLGCEKISGVMTCPHCYGPVPIEATGGRT